ncbi:MAG: hypothetical protein NC222_06240 [Staphylococcus sp.]|nr:hypothetical protein [Staphylococcus sp.]
MIKNKPNIKLRVYRREDEDMILIYNSRELRYLVGDKSLTPEITINGKNIDYYCDNSAVTNSAPGDIILFINYADNELDSVSRYQAYFKFGPNLKYDIFIEPKDIIPNLKDDKKMFVQTLGYDRSSKEWVKIPVEKDENDNYQVKVTDKEVYNVLLEIKEILKNIVK